MKRQLVTLFSIGLVIVLARESLAQQPPASKSPQSASISPETESQQTTPRAPHATEQAIISEINEIRSRLGGGVAQQFRDLNRGESWQRDAELEFNNELEQLAIANPISTDPPAFNDPGTVRTRANPNSTERVGSLKAVRGGPQTRRLRMAARSMDEMAAEFEEIGMYAEADEIRSQAKRFWLKARQMAPITGVPISRTPVANRSREN